MNFTKNETTHANIRNALADAMDSQASWRDMKAEEYPEDLRNERSARALRAFADRLRSDDTCDAMPGLQRILGLVIEHDNLPLDAIVPSGSASTCRSTGFMTKAKAKTSS